MSHLRESDGLMKHDVGDCKFQFLGDRALKATRYQSPRESSVTLPSTPNPVVHQLRPCYRPQYRANQASTRAKSLADLGGKIAETRTP